jgi:hypothetical protein
LQEKNEPVNFLSLKAFEVFSNFNPSFTDKIKKKLGIKTNASEGNTFGTFKDNIKKLKMVKNMLIKKIAMERASELSAFPNPMEMKAKIEELKNYINYLSAKGVKVVLFEMPIESELFNSPYCNSVRKELAKSLRSEKVIFLQTPDSKYFQTRDGVHLVEESASLYSLYFQEKAEEIIRSKENFNEAIVR